MSWHQYHDIGALIFYRNRSMVSDACNPRILPAWTQSFLCGGLHGVYFVIEFIVILYEVDLSDFLTLTVDNKKLLSPMQSEDT